MERTRASTVACWAAVQGQLVRAEENLEAQISPSRWKTAPTRPHSRNLQPRERRRDSPSSSGGIPDAASSIHLRTSAEYAPPFAGRRGRSRLSVIDGLVNEAVVRLVVSALPEDERVVVCGTAIDPEAKDALRKLRPGSTVRKIPHSILQEYRQAARWTQPSLFAGGGNGARMPEGEAAPA